MQMSKVARGQQRNNSVVEAMEARTVFSGVSLSGTVLSVIGTDGPDVIKVVVTDNFDSATQLDVSVAMNGTTVRYVLPGGDGLVVNGGMGNDTISTIDHATISAGSPYLVTSLSGGDGADTIDDEFAFKNPAYSGDIVNGDAGNDTLSGNNGYQATLAGGDGNDTLIVGTAGVGPQFDVLLGGAGDDVFKLLDGNDHIAVDGGDGSDTYLLDATATLGGSQTVALDGSPQSNTLLLPSVENVAGTFSGTSLNVIGNASDNNLTVGMAGGVETLSGMAGNDTLGGGGGSQTTYLYGGAGNDTLIGSPTAATYFSGGADNDTADYSARTGPVAVYLDGTKPSGQTTGTVQNYVTGMAVTGPADVFDGTVENVRGGSGNDVLVGNAASNVIFGNGGNDTITSNGGNDTLSGGDGDDTFLTRDGAVTNLNGDGGNNTATVDGNDVTTNVRTIGAATGTVTGTVFNDANGNGKQDAGETGSAGRTVYADLNNNGLLDAGEPSAVTTSAGIYAVTGVSPATVPLRLLAATGTRQTYPFNQAGRSVVVTTGTVAGGLFASTTNIYIAGTVFNDANKNGVRDAGETVLSGVRVYIDANNDGKYQSTEVSYTTGSDGSFSFGSLAAGTYTLRIVSPTGYTPAPAQTIALASGASQTAVLFAESKLGL